MSQWTKEKLIAFEEDIAACYDAAMIRAPVHLYNGNEEQMLDVFKRNNISSDDWIFTTWRSHYQCLLKGVPAEQLKADILAGKSITLCYPEYKIFSSAIVTGSIPIAVGVALALKRNKQAGRVYCFVGDMGSETGAFQENFKYSFHNKLPIKFIVEDNGKSVCTETLKTWGLQTLQAESTMLVAKKYPNTGVEDYLEYYKYESKWPHAGAGKRIQF
jgi:TPP-dependent pyruvate/acetoin dehydrogenase alpha subunit